MRTRLVLALLSLAACGAAPGPGMPPAASVPDSHQNLAGTIVQEGFDTWSTLNPPNCTGTDPLTSHCPASAPPDGWTLVAPRPWGTLTTAWNEHVHRAWETQAGLSALFFNECPVGVFNGCELHVLQGTPFPVTPGAYVASWYVRRGPGLGWAQEPQPNGALLRVEWLASDKATSLGASLVKSPDFTPLDTWVQVSGPATAPAGAAYARFALEVQPLVRSLYVDSLSLSAP